MEKDDEVKGSGNSYDYLARFYDPRVGRFLSVDPLGYMFPYLAPYSFAENDVIRSIDLDGTEKLVKTITDDPNSETGEPGHAKISISKDYYVVTAGVAKVGDYNKIDPGQFKRLYDKGDGTLFLKQLPNGSLPAVSLEGEELNWAKKAHSAKSDKKKIKYQNKLKEAGSSYWVTEIDYQYEIHLQENFSLNEGLNKIEEDPKLNGIIAMNTPRKEINEEVSSGGDVRNGFIQFNSRTLGVFEIKPDAGGRANVSDYDYVLLNPKTWYDDKAFNTTHVEIDVTGNSYVVMTYNRTECLVHEGGHNGTNNTHAANGYKYKDVGLSCNISGKIFPIPQNTIDIINGKDKSNGF